MRAADRGCFIDMRAGRILPSFDFDVFDAVAQNDVDEFVSRVIRFVRDPVQFGKCVFSDAHGDDAVTVLPASFDLQRFVLHSTHLVNS